MYAIVEIKGKQYRVEKGNVVKVDRLAEAKGETVDFEKVLMIHNDSGVQIGTPYLDGVTVKTTVEDHGRDKKILVFKYKKRKNYRRTHGHRQSYTTVTINDIDGL
jgi:large subunit ribosomal protein L21